MNRASHETCRSPNPSVAREKEELVTLLSLPGMTSGRLRELLTLFGSPRGALEAIEKGAAEGPDPPAAAWREALLSPGLRDTASRLKSQGIGVVVAGESGYPALLARIYDPPVALFYKGELPGDSPCAAIVGSRKATPYGLEAARWFAEGLAREGVQDAEFASQDVATQSKSAGVGNALVGAGHGKFSVVTFREIAKNRHSIHLGFRVAVRNQGNACCQTYVFDS